MKKDNLSEHILSKLDSIDSRLDTISETLIRNTVSLEIHEKRTTLLEEEFRPVQAHVTKVNTIGKFLIWIGGAAVGLMGILEYFKK